MEARVSLLIYCWRRKGNVEVEVSLQHVGGSAVSVLWEQDEVNVEVSLLWEEERLMWK
jgi:hypothetical protein